MQGSQNGCLFYFCQVGVLVAVGIESGKIFIVTHNKHGAFHSAREKATNTSRKWAMSHFIAIVKVSRAKDDTTVCH
jgi:hypothetical protein